MNRRSWLKLLVALNLTLKGSRHLNAEAVAETAADPRRVIVIGAGLAGLAAARELQAAGRNVLVLEARDRIGGRLWTSQKWPNMPLDLGASWIHGVTGNPLTALAKEANAKLNETSYDRNVIYDSNGDELTEDDVERLDRLRSEIQRALLAVQNTDNDMSVRQVVDRLQDHLPGNDDTRRLLNFIISSEFEQEYAGSAMNMSAHWYDSSDQFEGEDVLLVEGYGKLVEFLARDLNIQTSQVITRIDWTGTPVRVFTSLREFSADQVLVTLPLGVLKSRSVEFVPELPPSTVDPIEKLEMGVLNKCYLRFAEVFWPDDVDWLECVPQEHGEWVEWVSFARAANLPVLLGFNAADRGREMEAWSDQRIVASAMVTLRRIFGGDIPEPLDYQITRWASDPYSQGSYSFNPVGRHPRIRSQLAKPLGKRLYFAGEATEQEHFGTAHGAYLSGIRASREMIEGLG